MEIYESSEYVKARATLLGEYFARRGWVVSAGSCNSILFYISSGESFTFSKDQLMDAICNTDFHIKQTGLRTSHITYKFYHKGALANSFNVIPGIEFD